VQPKIYSGITKFSEVTRYFRSPWAEGSVAQYLILFHWRASPHPLLDYFCACCISNLVLTKLYNMKAKPIQGSNAIKMWSCAVWIFRSFRNDSNTRVVENVVSNAESDVCALVSRNYVAGYNKRGDFLRSLVRRRQWKRPFTVGINGSTRLATLVKGEAVATEQSLKIRRMKSEGFCSRSKEIDTKRCPKLAHSKTDNVKNSAK